MTSKERTSREWFAVSTEGMRQLHAGRPPWSLVKELVQNVWDESPPATRCEVQVRPAEGNGRSTEVEVLDDGPGFANIADVYTLMGPSAKQGNPSKRGRFNLGEKEIIAAARFAQVQTVGHTVTFDGKGRVRRRNGRTNGTRVLVRMPWGAAEREELLSMLNRFRPPPACCFIVNGRTMGFRAPMLTAYMQLPTVLQDSPGEPIRPTIRVAPVDVLEPLAGDGWLYEMGIPVQPIELPYQVTWLDAWDQPLEKVIRFYSKRWDKFREDLQRHRANELAGVGYAHGLRPEKETGAVGVAVTPNAPAWDHTAEDARAMELARRTLDERLEVKNRTRSTNCPGCGKLRNLGNNIHCFDCRKQLVSA